MLKEATAPEDVVAASITPLVTGAVRLPPKLGPGTRTGGGGGYRGTAVASASTDTAPRYYLSVDCGGSKAAAAITSSHPTPGTLLGVGVGGPANYTDISLAHFLRNCREAVEDACFNAKLIRLDQIPERLRLRPGYRHRYASTSSAVSTAGLLLRGTGTAVDVVACTSQETSVERHTLERDAFSIDDFVLRRRSGVLLDAEAEEIPLPRFEAAWFAVAGVDSARDVIKLKPHLANMLRLHDDDEYADRLRVAAADGDHLSIGAVPTGATARTRLIVANDTSLLAAPLHGSSSSSVSSPTSTAHSEETAVVAIAGTGSIVASFRRDSAGTVQPIGRAGGYGWLLGDEGSGFAVGREAIRRVLVRADRDRLRGVDLDETEEESPERQQQLQQQQQTDRASFSSVSLQQPESTGRAPRERRGRLLRRKILEYWKLSSTAELLAAVYSQESPAPPGAQSTTSTRPSSICSSDPPSDGVDEDKEVERERERERGTLPRRDTIKANDSRASPRQEGQGVDKEGGGGVGEGWGDVPLGSDTNEDSRYSADMKTPRNTSTKIFDSESDRPLSCEESSDGAEDPEAGEKNGAGNPHTVACYPGPPSTTGAYSLSSGHPSKRYDAVSTMTTLNGDATTIDSTNQTVRDPAFVHKMGERKHRLAGLATLVFELAFKDGDRECLSIVRGQAKLLARQILEVVDCDRRGSRVDGDSDDDDDDDEDEEGQEDEDEAQEEEGGSPEAALVLRNGDFNHSQEAARRPTKSRRRRRRSTASGLVDPARCVLCTGGSLLGVPGYRDMVIKECRELGEVTFSRSVYVGLPANTGAQALAQMWERERQE
ncbi:unnamed protein product [Tilletia controversa]|uniref:N-acetyl-D-glucosamine kinase n=3 Tax=Tilletia TaxID=13289 RepID=A0A8X7SYY5_9BASI|nr:hypothetical protein CF336_g3493 [Tilletia laevis]KAE8202475.1 hypothetical protein CF328_g2194 [Tilletia controversa]KAE8264383.1 hypothetical protein A4X03_0g994 [Tilletia caries]KAE8206841.1 hypothetical protein CF335_g1580 [Tilletia laevis]KAE8252899.1 hypothetical protein A4X06_0g1848 [Tilletia controversa]